MNTLSIDINCDVGEGVGNEHELLPLISSCNIACGGHAGDEDTIAAVAVMAKENKVKVGAHPSYPDKDNFGRLSLNIVPDDLISSIHEQLALFDAVLKTKAVALHHIKPHGALYNDIAKSAVLAKTFLKAIENYKNKVFLYVPYASVIAKEALDHGFRIKYEAFADRNYNADLSLVSRTLPNAVIEDPEKVLHHLILMAKKNQVATLEGEVFKIVADTFCIHGDAPAALQILTYLTQELSNHKIIIKRA